MEYEKIFRHIYEQIEIWGHKFRNIILSTSDLLILEWTPGFVSLLLVSLAVIIILYLLVRDWGRLNALKSANQKISKFKDRSAFSMNFLEVDSYFKNWAKSRNTNKHPLGVAWCEYMETVILPEPTSDNIVRNSLRPDVFFNTENLAFEPGWWRIWPGLFVSIGLLLTFLGLIAALTAIGGDEITDDSLRELMNAASAKFIMSLTGLACSIIMIFIGRMLSNHLEGRIQRLCHTLEKLLHYYCLEEIAKDQLNALEEQKAAIQNMATEMVAEIGRPLKEDLPAAIGKSFKEEVAPLLNALSKTSEKGLEKMVGELSEKMSGDVDKSMALASDKLVEAADKLVGLVSEIDKGAGRIGEEYESIFKSLGIKLKEEWELVTQELKSATQEMTRAAELVRIGGNTIVQSSKSLEISSQTLEKASEPLRVGIEDFRRIIESNIKHSQITTEKTKDVLESSIKILDEKGKGISSAMEGFSVIVERLKRQGEKLDTIDQKLGEAFEEYRTQVQTTIEDTSSKVGEIVDILNPALDTMKSIVEQAEEFVPQGKLQGEGHPE